MYIYIYFWLRLNDQCQRSHEPWIQNYQMLHWRDRLLKQPQAPFGIWRISWARDICTPSIGNHVFVEFIKCVQYVFSLTSFNQSGEWIEVTSQLTWSRSAIFFHVDWIHCILGDVEAMVSHLYIHPFFDPGLVGILISIKCAKQPWLLGRSWSRWGSASPSGNANMTHLYSPLVSLQPQAGKRSTKKNAENDSNKIRQVSMSIILSWYTQTI